MALNRYLRTQAFAVIISLESITRMLKGHKKLTSEFRTAMNPKTVPKKAWVPQPRIVIEDAPSSKEAELLAENKALKERVDWLESVLPESDWRGTEWRKNMQQLVAQRDALASENEQLKAQINRGIS